METKVKTYLRLLVILLIFSVFVDYSAYSQKVLGTKNDIIQIRKLPDFNSIIFDGDMNIRIFQGNKKNVVLVGDGDLIDNIQTKVIDKKLMIFSNDIRKLNNFEISISLNHLKMIDIYGDMNIIIETPVNINELEIYLADECSTLKLDIKGKKFNCVISGIGDIDIKSEVEHMNVSIIENVVGSLVINAKTLRSKVSWLAEVSFEGETDLLDLYVSSMGYVNAFNLISQTCYVNMEDNSDVSVNCIEKLFVNGTGKSLIYYQGDPADKYVNLTGSAKIRKRPGLFTALNKTQGLPAGNK